MNNKKLVLHDETVKFLNSAVRIVAKGKPQTVLLRSESGAGKTTLLKNFRETQEQDHTTLFHFNPVKTEENPFDYLYEIFFYLWNSNRPICQKVKNYFVNHTLGDIAILDTKANDGFINTTYQYYYNIVPDILKDFIFICSQHNPIHLIFENIHLYTAQTQKWLFQLVSGINHPILTVFTVDSDKLPNNLPPEIQHHTLPALNVKEVEKLIQKLLSRGPVNAKFITNFIHLKSEGNPAFIAALLPAVFEDNSLYVDDILDANKIEPASLPVSWLNLWEIKWKALNDPEKAAKLLYAMELFAQERSLNFWKKYSRSAGLETVLNDLLEKRWLKAEKNLNEKNVTYFHISLANFIQLKLNSEENPEIFAPGWGKAVFGKMVSHFPYSPLLLHHFSRKAGKVIKIFKVLKKLSETGKYRQIINILNAIVISPYFEELSRKRKITILKLLAETYEHTGNYENSLMQYQRLSDLVAGTKEIAPEEIKYRIAFNLYKMDKIEEALYILQKLTDVKKMEVVLRAEIYYLFGLIFSAHLQYQGAGEFLKKSLKIIKEDEREEARLLEADIYRQLASVYRKNDKEMQAVEMLEAAQKILFKANEISGYLKVVLHKTFIWQNIMEPTEALRKIVGEYYKIRHLYAPEIMEILQKQIAELYWLIGKWRHANHYYNKLFEYFNWRGDIFNASFMIGNMATISKETGEFGKAIQLEERALRLEHISQNVKAMVYSFQNLGHIYLMLGNYYHAKEQFNKALHLAEKNNLVDEQIINLLLQGFLFTRQKKLPAAGEYFDEAKKLIDMTENDWGWTNYLFYRGYWQYRKENYSEAESSASLFLKKTFHIYKYQCTGYYLKGLIFWKKGEKKDALILLQKALAMTDKLPMIFWRFQIAYAIAKLYDSENEGVKAEEMLGVALNSIIKIAKSLSDKILEAQFWESNEISEVLNSIKKIPNLNIRLLQWQIEQ